MRHYRRRARYDAGMAAGAPPAVSSPGRWVQALIDLPDNPVRRLLQQQNERQRSTRVLLSLLLLALAAGWALAEPFDNPWSTVAAAGLLASLSLGLLYPAAQGVLAWLGHDAARGGRSGPLELDDALAVTPLDHPALLVGLLAHYLPQLMVIPLAFSLPLAAHQLHAAEAEFGIYATARYPHALRGNTMATLTGLVLERRSAPEVTGAVLELLSGGPAPSRRLRWSLPVSIAGITLCGTLALLGWLSLLLACGRELPRSLLAPLSCGGTVLAQALLSHGQLGEWQGQRLAGWGLPPAPPDWLLSSAALCLIAIACGLQLLPLSRIWRLLLASGLPLSIFALLPGLARQLLAQQAIYIAPPLYALLSGLQLVLAGASFASPLAAPLPLYGGLQPGAPFTPPLWHWWSWPLLLALQLVLTAELLKQAQLAIALRRGAELD
jgi:hypothetical protein